MFLKETFNSMKKQTKIIIGVAAVGAVAGVGYYMYGNRTKSISAPSPESAPSNATVINGLQEIDIPNVGSGRPFNQPEPSVGLTEINIPIATSGRISNQSPLLDAIESNESAIRAIK